MSNKPVLKKSADRCSIASLPVTMRCCGIRLAKQTARLGTLTENQNNKRAIMSFDITITLSEEDIQRFQQSIDEGRHIVADPDAAERVEELAADLIEKVREIDLPSFISDRLLKLQILINMIRDSEWQLDPEDRTVIRSVLYYFVNPDDVIPDHVPGLGFLDDALYAEIVIQELSNEIRSYQEFCQFRIAEETRLNKLGLDTRVGREDWLASKRAALHARMRERQRLAKGGRGLRMRLL